jgi:hypothetical protein
MAEKSVKSMKFQHVAGIWGIGGGLYMRMGDLEPGDGELVGLQTLCGYD